MRIHSRSTVTCIALVLLGCSFDRMGASDVGSFADGSDGTAGSGGVGDQETLCIDGLDNNDDGLADCADPDCGSVVECVSAAPDPWKGGYRIIIHSLHPPDKAPPKGRCPDGSNPVRYQAGLTGPLNCECSCEAMKGTVCDPADMNCSDPTAENCSNMAIWKPPGLSTEHCVAFETSILPPPRYCQLTTQPGSMKLGTCKEQQKVLNRTPWDKIVDVCFAEQSLAGCSGGICAPKATGGYVGRNCIQQDGHVECPDGWRAASAQVFTDSKDNRTCSNCSCVPKPGSASCGNTSYSFYEGDRCDQEGTSVETIACTFVGQFLGDKKWAVELTLPEVNEGACSPDGGVPSGEVNFQTPKTFCCE